MRFLYDNIAPLFVAFVASMMAWLYGGMDAPSLASATPWLLLFLAEVIIVFPQKHAGESTYDCRERVWKAMKKDPLVWTGLGLILLLAIPFLNNGLCPNCDRVKIAAGVDPEPLITFIPWCVNRLQHYNVFLWFVTAITSMIAVKHALTHHGKRVFIKMVVWNGFLLAILGFVQIAAEAPGPLWRPIGKGDGSVVYFSTFGYPNMAGDYFTTLFGLAVACWRDAYEEVRAELKALKDAAMKDRYRLFWRKYLYLVLAAVFFFAAINTLSRAAIILVTSLAGVYFLHTFIAFTHRMKRAERVKKGTISLALVGLVIFFASLSIPEDLQHEVDTINADAVLERVSGKGQYHARVATEIWKDNLLFGCGGWGYIHFCIPKMTPEERKQLQKVGGINVHNDHLQFLAEHGLVGFGAMVIIVIMLLLPIYDDWRLRLKKLRFAKKHDLPAAPIQLFAIPAPVFIILMTAVATAIHGFGDCPLRSAAVFVLFFSSLAALPGFEEES